MGVHNEGDFSLPAFGQSEVLTLPPSCLIDVLIVAEQKETGSLSIKSPVARHEHPKATQMESALAAQYPDS